MCEHIVIHMYYISIICKIFVHITQYIKVEFLAMNLKVFEFYLLNYVCMFIMY